MRLIHTENLLNQSAYKTLPKGTYRGLLFKFAGTNQSGKTAAITNFGTVRVNRKGTDIANVDTDLLWGFNSVEFGFPQFSSTTGGAFNAAFYLPFAAPWDANSGAFFGDGEAFVQLQFSYFNLVQITDGTVEIYAIEAPQVASYLWLMLQRNVAVGGAGQVVQTLDLRNISALYIQNNSNVTNYLISADKNVLVNASDTALLYETNMFSAIEAAQATVTILKADLNPFHNISSNLNSVVEEQVTATGATNLRQVAGIIAFSSAMAEASSKYVSSRISAAASADDVA
jgi:hypothetical protein